MQSFSTLSAKQHRSISLFFFLLLMTTCFSAFSITSSPLSNAAFLPSRLSACLPVCSPYALSALLEEVCLSVCLSVNH